MKKEDQILDRLIKLLKKSNRKMDRILKNKNRPKKNWSLEKIWLNELKNDKKWEDLARRNRIGLVINR